MVYVSNGQVLGSRGQAPWRLSSIVQMFWGIVEFIRYFFQTMINPTGADHRTTGSVSSWGRPDDGRGPPGVPRRRMGRINNGKGGPPPPPMSGG
ncbi:selenoprotein K [Callorhinchus milii]|nr:selenoprotein K [Callorhinchus milii]|eukprot:gi/632946752/ref/XP_007888713.1/ PREDICTED: selenoprotein K [Callorhinchus milii]